MKKYPHALTLIAVCAAIEDYQRHENSVPEEGILAAFNTLLAHSDIAEAFRALEQQRDALAAENEALKSAADIIKALNAQPEEARFCGFEDWQIDNAVEAMSAPATDAYLNSVRADVIKQLHSEQKEWALHTWQYDNFDALKRAAVRHGDSELSGVIFMLDRIEGFAAQLRDGKDGE